MATVQTRGDYPLMTSNSQTRPTSSSQPASGREGKAVEYPGMDGKELSLPDLRTSENMIDKSKPLPTSLQSDFIPQELLVALTQPPPVYEKLGPLSRYRNLNTTVSVPRKPPASVWNYPKRRDQFKHLTKNTPCVCGAGRDISFLYDVPKDEDSPVKQEEFDQSVIRFEEDVKKRKPMQLPDTLIPEEYHIVKNKGVMGLEYKEDKFATQAQDHTEHLVVFPSLNPTSRFEVLQLKTTLNQMLEKAGINEEVEMRGPTQMHNLLELIKKEQNIYNIVFHELIRQVSVECMERGELLAEIRQKYSDLLNKVPKQVKSLHEEVMAQRALDRRLTEELLRFKSTIGVLTSELNSVKEHDKEVTLKAQQAQEDLKSALSESQKNAGLLNEYHDLYELQRKRVQKQVTQLTNEKEVWSCAAYSLALKVTEEHGLNTARRLQVCEKSWLKLAKHFTILLSDKDTEVLTQLQSYMDKWRDLVDRFHRDINCREEQMKSQLKAVRGGIEQWIKDFRKHVLSSDGHIAQEPDRNKTEGIYSDVHAWEELLGAESEKFGGDTLLSGQDCLVQIRNQMEGWTQSALTVFSRHGIDNDKNKPHLDEMYIVNQEVEELVNQYQVRLTGENGVVTGLIHIGNSLENWNQKFLAVLHGHSSLQEQDWVRFLGQLDDWTETIHQTLSCIGLTQKTEDKLVAKSHHRIDAQDTMKHAQKWLASTKNGLNSEDDKLVEEVSTLNDEMVQWMVQVLLRLAPDRPDHSAEAKEAILLGSTTIGELQSNAKSLFQALQTFTLYVTNCCNGIVTEAMQEKLDAFEEDAEHEYNDMQKLKTECLEWIRTASLLLCELTGDPYTDPTPSSSFISVKSTKSSEYAYHDKEKLTNTEQAEEQEGTDEKEGTELSIDTAEETKKEPEEEDKPGETVETEAKPASAADTEKLEAKSGHVAQTEEVVPQEEITEKLEFIGFDANTHVAQLEQKADDPPQKDRITGSHPQTPDTKRAFEALAAVNTLQEQLLATEERAQEAENRAADSELELADTQERLRALERRLADSPDDNVEIEKPAAVANSSPTAPAGETAESSKDESKKDDKGKHSKDKPVPRTVSRGSTKARRGKHNV